MHHHSISSCFLVQTQTSKSERAAAHVSQGWEEAGKNRRLGMKNYMLTCRKLLSTWKSLCSVMTSFNFEEFSEAWTAWPMLAALFELELVNNHNTAPTIQPIHLQLGVHRSILTRTRTTERKWLSDYLKKASCRCFYLKRFRRESFHLNKAASLYT